MLEGIENVVLLSMFHDVAGDNVFHDLAADTSQGDWSVVCCIILLSFLVHRGDIGFGPDFWDGSSLVRFSVYYGEYGCNLTREFFKYPGLDRVWSCSFMWIKSIEKFFYPLASNVDFLGRGEDFLSGRLLQLIALMRPYSTLTLL